MIVTTTRHGRTRRDARYLLAHLSRRDVQRSRVVHVGAPVADERAALDYMQALRDGSRATVSFHHLSLSPGQPLTDEQRDEAVRRVLAAMGAEDHAHVIWEHAQKRRRGRDVDAHYHVVVSHIGPDGKALRDGRSYVRLEAVARALEADFGHEIIPGRRPAAVAAELERQGRPDVAARVRGEAAPEPPASAMSSRQRARAERHGVSLPDMRVAVRQAWEASDSPAALQAALAEHGLGVAQGDKAGVWIVTGPDGMPLGALDRLAGERRRTVATRMQEETHDHGTATRDAGFESDLRRGQGRTRGGRGPEPAAVAPGTRPAGRGLAVGRGDGTPRNDPAGTAGHPHGDREAGRPTRRADGALAVAALAQAARDRTARREARRLQRLYRPKGRDVLNTRRLARVDLDEIRRMAEELARGWIAFLSRSGPPPVLPIRPERPDPHAALRARLHDIAERPRRSFPAASPDKDEPAHVHRPRM